MILSHSAHSQNVASRPLRGFDSGKSQVAQPPSSFHLAPIFDDRDFDYPVAVVKAPSDPGTAYVVERPGRVHQINLTDNQTTVFLDLTTIANIYTNGECGLLGMAFHPDYNQNGYLYVIYSYKNPDDAIHHQRLSRFKATGTPGDYLAATSVDPTEFPMITQSDGPAQHNGGHVEFGPDGYLYFSFGERGTGPNRIDKGFFGAIYRIDVNIDITDLFETLEATQSPRLPNPYPLDGGVIDSQVHPNSYLIPTDNPYQNQNNFPEQASLDSATVRTEIWATGLRNPWRFCFIPGSGGDILAADIGSGFSTSNPSFVPTEEINYIPAAQPGQDFGWPGFEGTQVKSPEGDNHNDLPSFSYQPQDIAANQACIISGLIYDGPGLGPELQGKYIFADRYNSTIYTLTPTAGGGFVESAPVALTVAGIYSPASLHAHPASGEILVVPAILSGVSKIYQLVPGDGCADYPALLSQTPAFSNGSVATVTPSPEFHEYGVNHPFWSDHAEKRRWFSTPNPSSDFGYSQSGQWTYPTGAVWLKHFELPSELGDPNSPKIRVETRFLVKTASGVEGYTYRWDPDQSDAELVECAGEIRSIDVDEDDAPKSILWRFPSQATCNGCHNAETGYVLGFNTNQLNRDRIGAPGQNQLDWLNAMGVLSGNPNPATAPAYVVPGDASAGAEELARTFLEVNCAMCHQSDQFDLRMSNASCNLANGVPVRADGNPDLRYAAPGDLANSEIFNRVCGITPLMPMGAAEPSSYGADVIMDWILDDLVCPQIIGLPSVTSSNSPITLVGSPAGGVFSGTGVVFSAFNPSIAGVGQHTVTYTWTDEDGVDHVATAPIFVFTIDYNFVNYNQGTVSPE